MYKVGTHVPLVPSDAFKRWLHAAREQMEGVGREAPKESMKADSGKRNERTQLTTAVQLSGVRGAIDPVVQPFILVLKRCQESQQLFLSRVFTTRHALR